MPSEPQDWDWDIVKSLKNNCADLKGDRHTQCMNNLSHAASVGLAHANATHHALNKSTDHMLAVNNLAVRNERTGYGESMKAVVLTNFQSNTDQKKLATPNALPAVGYSSYINFTNAGFV